MIVDIPSGGWPGQARGPAVYTGPGIARVEMVIDGRVVDRQAPVEGHAVLVTYRPLAGAAINAYDASGNRVSSHAIPRA